MAEVLLSWNHTITLFNTGRATRCGHMESMMKEEESSGASNFTFMPVIKSRFAVPEAPVASRAEPDQGDSYWFLSFSSLSPPPLRTHTHTYTHTHMFKCTCARSLMALCSGALSTW